MLSNHLNSFVCFLASLLLLVMHFGVPPSQALPQSQPQTALGISDFPIAYDNTNGDFYFGELHLGLGDALLSGPRQINLRNMEFPFQDKVLEQTVEIPAPGIEPGNGAADAKAVESGKQLKVKLRMRVKYVIADVSLNVMPPPMPVVRQEPMKPSLGAVGIAVLMPDIPAPTQILKATMNSGLRR